MNAMRAVIIPRYGGPEVLELRDVDKPKAGPGQVLIHVRATSVNPIDWKIRSGALKMFMPKKLPFIPGCDLAGEVVEVGAGAKLAVGDAVMVALEGDSGAHAEYVAVSADLVARKPKNMSFEEAASVPAAAGTALQALRDMGGVKPGQRVLVNGASGGVGLFAVQIGKALGAHVTGVCSTGNVAMVKGLGADDVIDYKTSDVFAAGRERYDMIFDLIGAEPLSKWAAMMTPHGVYVAASPQSWIGAFARQTFLNPFTSQKAFVIILKHSGASLQAISDMIEQGKVRTVLDRVLPLADVAEAQKRSESGRTVGKIVLTMS